MYLEFDNPKALAEAIQTHVNKAKEQGKTLDFEILTYNDFTIMENPSLNPYDVNVDTSKATLTICGIDIYIDSYNFGDYYWRGWQGEPDILYFNNAGFEDVLYMLMINNF